MTVRAEAGLTVRQAFQPGSTLVHRTRPYGDHDMSCTFIFFQSQVVALLPECHAPQQELGTVAGLDHGSVWPAEGSTDPSRGDGWPTGFPGGGW